MKTINLKRNLIYVALLGATILLYNVTKSATVVMLKGTNSVLPYSFVLNNVVTFPMITLKPYAGSSSAENMPSTLDTDGAFNFGTFRADNAKLVGQVQVDIQTGRATSLGGITTVRLSFSPATLDVANSADATKKITLNIGVSDSAASRTFYTAINNLTNASIINSVDQKFTGYLYFESTAPITAGSLPDGVYQSASGITILAAYD